MGGASRYALTRHGHAGSLSAALDILRRDQDLVDVTLGSGTGRGRLYGAHRLILAACSPYLREAVMAASHGRHPVIIIKEATTM
jgi:hypothetical protein